MRMLAALALLLAACAPSAPPAAEQPAQAPSPAPAPPVTPAPPTPAPAPTPIPAPQPPTAEELTALGVVLTGGFSPHAHLGRTNGVLNWPPYDEMPQAIGDPPVPEGLGPLVIDARIERSPISCITWMRTIASVDVGSGAAASAIEAEIVRVADAEHARFLSRRALQSERSRRPSR